MITKTQGIFSGMNYFLTFKESGGKFCDAYSDILKATCDIYTNKAVRENLSETAIEDFERFLPGTSEVFEHASMHGDLSFIRGYFDESLKVRMSEITQEKSKVR